MSNPQDWTDLCQIGRFPEQLWIDLAARLGRATDDEEVRQPLERWAADLRGELEANSDSFQRHLKREYHSLKLQIMSLNRQLAGAALADGVSGENAMSHVIGAAGERLDFRRLITDLRSLEEACEVLESNSKLVVCPRGKRYEKLFLRRLSRLLDSHLVHLSGRKRAGIAFDLIRWVGGHPASLASIARYMRHPHHRE